jgi:hypothetical protein
MENPVEIVVGDTAVLTLAEERAVGGHRTNLSVLHLEAAASHSRAVCQLERDYVGPDWGTSWHRIFASASATVFASVAALEAYTNELIIDRNQVFPAATEEERTKLWKLYKDRKPTLEKVQFALRLKGVEVFDTEVDVGYTHVEALIKLRNALTHFAPEWTDEQKKHADVSTRLTTCGISPSSVFPAGEPLFPCAWASHSCTQWAVKSVRDFLVEFESRIGTAYRLTPHVMRFANT